MGRCRFVRRSSHIAIRFRPLRWPLTTLLLPPATLAEWGMGNGEFGMRNKHRSNSFPIPTFPTKVPSGNLGRIGKMRDIDYNSLFLMALRGQARRFTHQLRPMNVNRCSILSVTSILHSAFEPLATIPSRCCSFHPGSTRPRCEPSGFSQLALSGYFARLAGPSDRADQFPCVNEHTPRAASRPERRAGLHLIPNWKRASARSRHTQYTARLPDPCGRLRKVVSS